jgi:cytidine deaminase
MQLAVFQIEPNAIPLKQLLSTKRDIVSDDQSVSRIPDGIIDSIVESAREASASSYAPYSRFRVGAAILCEDGSIFRGVNVENRSYGLGICAERSAIFAAVTAGHTRFTAIAVYSPDADYPVSPCGACRQVISEFMGPESLIIFAARDGKRESHTVQEVFPFDALHELKDRPVD